MYARLGREHGYDVSADALKKVFRGGIGVPNCLTIAFAEQARKVPRFGITNSTPVEKHRYLCLHWWTEVAS